MNNPEGLAVPSVLPPEEITITLKMKRVYMPFDWVPAGTTQHLLMRFADTEATIHNDEKIIGMTGASLGGSPFAEIMVGKNNEVLYSANPLDVFKGLLQALESAGVELPPSEKIFEQPVEEKQKRKKKTNG